MLYIIVYIISYIIYHIIFWYSISVLIYDIIFIYIYIHIYIYVILCFIVSVCVYIVYRRISPSEWSKLPRPDLCARCKGCAFGRTPCLQNATNQLFLSQSYASITFPSEFSFCTPLDLVLESNKHNQVNQLRGCIDSIMILSSLSGQAEDTDD